MMTAEEFEAAYAARSGVTVALLHSLGRHAEPCDCSDDMCEGWQMAHKPELSPRTLGEALHVTCEQCGAAPGEDCHDKTVLPEGRHRVHTVRMFD